MRAVVRAVVTLGHGNLGVARFRDPWTINGGRTIVPYPGDFEVRLIKNGGELLLRVRPYRDYSDNCYAVSLDGRFSARPASESEWNQAEPVAKSQKPLAIPPGQTSPAKSAHFHGKDFVKSGESWGVALPSPDERWIALLSYTSPESPPKNETIFKYVGGGNEPQRGEIFLDVYDAASGEKILAGRSKYSRLGPSMLFAVALWADSRFFILPLDYFSKNCFLGILPAE